MFDSVKVEGLNDQTADSVSLRCVYEPDED